MVSEFDGNFSYFQNVIQQKKLLQVFAAESESESLVCSGLIGKL